MSRLIDTRRLREIAEVEFSDIVLEALIPDENQLRILLKDGSFVDVWYSLKLSERYSYHWERRAIDGTIYRHDNAPHKRWQSVEMNSLLTISVRFQRTFRISRRFQPLADGVPNPCSSV
jgi:hypothetical protein